MKTHTRVFSIAKSGNASSDNQDAYSDVKGVDGYAESSAQRFAVADGASEALFSGQWARLLTDAWADGRLHVFGEQYLEVLQTLADNWRASISTEDLPWWAEQKLSRGSFAALAVLQLIEAPSGQLRWSFSAVGDSCVFLVRENEIIYSAPISRSDDFNSSPYLISTISERNSDISRHLFSHEDIAKTGDEFILATDSLSCWICKMVESGKKPSEMFLFLDREDRDKEFECFVSEARNVGEMRNDDVTFMSIMIL